MVVVIDALTGFRDVVVIKISITVLSVTFVIDMLLEQGRLAFSARAPLGVVLVVEMTVSPLGVVLVVEMTVS